MKTGVHISGAGPSGLTAAIAVAKGGGRAIVHECRESVGMRFHGDFQGLENWTTKSDVLEELCSIGIEPRFDHTPYRELVVFGPDGREHAYRSSDPIFYLLRRGPHPGTLDASLKEQAIACGVEIRYGASIQHLPEGGIVAHGPRGSDAIAVGYLFETDATDAAFGVVGDQLAPNGYSYLLVHNGIGTVASTIFRDYHNERQYLERTTDFFRKYAGLRMKNEQPFGGVGNFFVPRTARKENLLFAGEAAGFQDALWGFGMRYAMLSGSLAAQAVLSGASEKYDSLWNKRLGGLLRAGIVNRYMFEQLGDATYGRLLNQVDHGADIRDWLRTTYKWNFWKRMMYPLAHRAVRASRNEAACVMEGCDCTWCRCQHAAG